jgi:RNA polymerase sigma factor (sigma-70 family)
VPAVDDRALVAAMVSGDPRGLDGAYRRYAPQLHAYCVVLLGDGEQAADALHDTFVLAGERISQLRDPDRLRPWLYTIARHECLRHRRGRFRLTGLDAADDPAADTVDLTATVHADQVRELVHAAAAGLTGGDRDVIELALRHGLAAGDVAAVLGVSTNHAHARLSRARSRLEHAIGVLLVARAGRSACPTLAGLLDGWNGRLDPVLRKRLSRHVDRCAECSERRGRLVHPAALLTAFTAGPALGAAGTWWFRTPDAGPDPAPAAPDAAPAAPDAAPAGGAPNAAPDSGADGRPDPDVSLARPGRRAVRRAVTAVAAVLVLVAIVATLTRVTDPAELAGQQRLPAAAPSATPAAATPSASPEQSAALTPEDGPSLRPGDSGSTAPDGDEDGSAGDDLDRSRTPVEFEIDVERSAVSCAADGKTYVLSVRVRGTRPVRLATVFWRASPTVPADEQSLGRVDSVTREGSSDSMRLPTIEWWVEATAVGGGQAATGKRTATNPCRR